MTLSGVMLHDSSYQRSEKIDGRVIKRSIRLGTRVALSHSGTWASRIAFSIAKLEESALVSESVLGIYYSCPDVVLA